MWTQVIVPWCVTMLGACAGFGVCVCVCVCVGLDMRLCVCVHELVLFVPMCDHRHWHILLFFLSSLDTGTGS